MIQLSVIIFLPIYVQCLLHDVAGSPLHCVDLSLFLQCFFIKHKHYNCYNVFDLQHLCVLLACPDLDVVLAVLNLLYVFSKRSNFISRLAPKKRAHLNSYLEYLAEVCPVCVRVVSCILFTLSWYTNLSPCCVVGEVLGREAEYVRTGQVLCQCKEGGKCQFFFKLAINYLCIGVLILPSN